jgi:flagellar M-ring protein FliF
VHLVIPKRELFSKEKIQPSASIILRMKAGQRLSSNQVQAVQALVTSAVSNMTNDRISIIDDKGTLLAKGRDAGGLADTFSNQSTIKEEFEEKLSRQIEMLLERTVGPDHVRVEISVDMDFDRVTTQSVDFDPDGQVARSINSTEEGVNANEVNGAADAVSIQNAIPNKENQNAGGKASSESKNASNKIEEVTAFEISNKTTTTVRETGNIKRMSVAVLVDGNYQKDATGKVVYTVRSPEEVAQLTELVQTAIGFKADRGDIVKVINMKFQAPEDIQQMEATPIWQIWLDSLNFKRLMELMIIGIFSLIVIFSFLKPFVGRLLTLKPVEAPSIAFTGDMANDLNSMSKGNAVNVPKNVLDSKAYPNSTSRQKVSDDFDDEEINLLQVEGVLKSSTLNQISQLIEQNPAETLSLLRSWLYEEK